MFEYILLNSPDLIISNKRSNKKIPQYCTIMVCFKDLGVLKTRTVACLFWNSYSRFFHPLTQKSNFQNLQENQPKSQISASQPHIAPHIVKTLIFQPFHPLHTPIFKIPLHKKSHP